MIKKRDTITGTIISTLYPGIGVMKYEDKIIQIPAGIPGMNIDAKIVKKTKNIIKGNITKVNKHSEFEIKSPCPHFDICGGCTYQNISDDYENKIKSDQIYNLISPLLDNSSQYEGIIKSPITIGYRNKMEFTFGDETKGGELTLGLHKKNSFYDIIEVNKCMLIHPDIQRILSNTSTFFRNKNIPYFHKMTHDGILRNLIVRYSITQNELLLCLVTTDNLDRNILSEWVNEINNLNLENKIIGIIHTINNSYSDAVKNEQSKIIFGRDYIIDTVCNLKFNISAFSFFQTNTYAAELMYKKVKEYLGSTNNEIILDLYSGTGTISQIISDCAKKIISVEIVEDAVNSAKKNAIINGITNIDFICNDVLKEIDNITSNNKKIDAVILDPPREGINPKALPKILNLSPKKIIYVSCKATSFVRDYETIKQYGYKIEKCASINQFPNTAHTELIVSLIKN